MGNTEEHPQDLQAYPKNDIFPIKKGQKESGSNSSILEHEIESSRQQQQKKDITEKRLLVEWILPGKREGAGRPYRKWHLAIVMSAHRSYCDRLH